jgi:hypothetical protein
MRCALCGKRLAQDEVVYTVTRGVFDEEDDFAAELEEVGVYCTQCFPALPEGEPS